MHLDIQLALAGAAPGALLALLAAGLLIQFRSSGVLNLAHGAMATLSAYTFLYAADDWNWPVPVAIAAGVLAATSIAGVFQIAVIRPMREAAPLAKVVATLGLMLALISVVPVIFGRRQPPTVRIFGEGVYELPFGDPAFVIGRSRAWFIVLAVVTSLVLWAVFKYTQFGRATRAASDNERAAELLGYNAQRLDLVNWMLGGFLGGVAGVLLATLTPPSPTNYTLSLIAAVAVALLARFQSFSIMLIAGIVVGSVQAVLLRYASGLQELTDLSGWGEALPLGVIIFTVVFGGRSIISRGQRTQRPLPDAPAARHPIVAAVAALGIGAVWYWIAPEWLVNPTTKSLIFVIVALSVVVLTGYTGQVSLAQLSLAGFGAWVTAKTATEWGLGFPWTVLLGGLAVVPIAFLLGAPSVRVRVRGTSLAVVTLAAAIVMDVMFFADNGLTGADAGLRVPPDEFLGFQLNGLTSRRQLGVVVVVMTVLCGLVVAFLRRSSLGQRMVATRSNERGAAGTGVSVARTKLAAFMVSGMLAGVAGSLEGYRSVQISWTEFAFMESIILVAFAYMGGTTYISGAIATGIIAPGGITSEMFNFEGTAKDAVNIAGGLGVLLVVLVHPAGIGYDGQRLVRAVGRALARPFGRLGSPGTTGDSSVHPRLAESEKVRA